MPQGSVYTTVPVPMREQPIVLVQPTQPVQPVQPIQPQQESLPVVQTPVNSGSATTEPQTQEPTYEQMSFVLGLDREAVIKFINEQDYLTYLVRMTKINSYLKLLLSLAGLLTQNLIYKDALDEVKK